ncbi:MAG: hypothetical protein P4L51_09685 [Puia sp.]|nr:hypothetical protein [Puia sp.]
MKSDLSAHEASGIWKRLSNDKVQAKSPLIPGLDFYKKMLLLFQLGKAPNCRFNICADEISGPIKIHNQTTKSEFCARQMNIIGMFFPKHDLSFSLSYISFTAILLEWYVENQYIQTPFP